MDGLLQLTASAIQCGAEYDVVNFLAVDSAPIDQRVRSVNPKVVAAAAGAMLDYRHGFV